MPITPPLTDDEIASLPSAIGFIQDYSQEVADWLEFGFGSGDGLPDDIVNLERAAQYMRGHTALYGDYKEGAASVASRITAMIQGSSVPVLTSHTTGDTLNGANQTFSLENDSGLCITCALAYEKMPDDLSSFDSDAIVASSGLMRGDIDFHFTHNSVATDGQEVHLRVEYRNQAGIIGYQHYQFTAHTQVEEIKYKPFLISHEDGETISAGDLTLVINAGVDAPSGRQFDHHGSIYPQPANDASTSNELYDSVGIGTATSFTPDNPIPTSVTKIYGRIRYSDNGWSDADTTIAEGRYTDYILYVGAFTDIEEGLHLSSPANGSTITSSALTLVVTNGNDEVAGRQYDHHGSVSVQPAVDGEYGNDLYDSVGIGTAKTFTPSGGIPSNTTKIYGRIRYSDNGWADAATTIADGRYYDYIIYVDIATAEIPDGSGWLGSAGMAEGWAIKDAPLQSIGSMSKTEYNAITGNTWSSIGTADLGIVDIDGKRALGVTLHRESGNGTNGTDKIQGRIPLGGEFSYCKIRYLVYFPAGFDFGNTGRTMKLGPGLYPGDSLSTGGELDSDGGSLRPIYKHKSGSSAEVHPGAYVYRQDQADKYGDEHPYESVDISTGSWHEVVAELYSQSVAGASNGVARMWWNGQIVYQDTAVPWVNNGKLTMNQIVWGMFMGGSNTAAKPDYYSPDSDQTFYITEFSYTTSVTTTTTDPEPEPEPEPEIEPEPETETTPIGPSNITATPAALTRNSFEGMVGYGWTMNAAETIRFMSRPVGSVFTQDHDIELWDASTGSKVATATITPSSPRMTVDGVEYAYEALAAPVTLASGTAYTIVSREFSGGDNWQDLLLATLAESYDIIGSAYLSSSGIGDFPATVSANLKAYVWPAVHS